MNEAENTKCPYCRKRVEWHEDGDDTYEAVELPATTDFCNAFCKTCQVMFACCPSCTQHPDHGEGLEDYCTYDDWPELKNVTFAKFLGAETMHGEAARFNPLNSSLNQKDYCEVFACDTTLPCADDISFFVGDANVLPVGLSHTCVKLKDPRAQEAWECTPLGGPDGGFPLYWHCPKCSLCFATSDK